MRAAVVLDMLARIDAHLTVLTVSPSAVASICTSAVTAESALVALAVTLARALRAAPAQVHSV